MALFGKSRDISLFHNLNNELLKDIIQTEVAYYKFALEQTTANVYGESMGKNYYEPMKIACLIKRDDQSWSSNEFGSDVNQSVGFQFLKNELKNINLIPEVGDILLFRNNFYELDGKIENQLIMGRDPDYAISTETVDFGDSFSILVSTHISRVEKLNLIPLRGGKYPTTTKVDGGIANQLG
tara:strand:- start:13805 stop:14350 length:546 start_codon:yes stop_codon:yes gene_type:complete